MTLIAMAITEKKNGFAMIQCFRENLEKHHHYGVFQKGESMGYRKKKQSNLSHGGFIKHFCPWNTMAIPISVDFLEAADLPSALASSDPSSLAPSCHPSAISK